jgi:hypothetical protein
MDERFRSIAASAASQHSVVSLAQLQRAGIESWTRSRWQEQHLLVRLGPKSFAIGGAAPTWHRDLTAALFDLDGAGVIGGRSAAQLMRLDGFNGNAVELIAPRTARGRIPSGTAHYTRRPIGRQDTQRIDGLVVVSAERLILDAPLFGFTRNEIENAIDSAIRLRLVGEQRLRTRVVAEHHRSRNGGRQLLDALVDTGGESRLERWLLRLCRDAGLPRPMLQKVYRAGARTIARVDAEFAGGLVVEVAGHGTHATRLQRQRDAQRHTELTLMGKRVLTFTYEDLRDRPRWVAEQLHRALRMAA